MNKYFYPTLWILLLLLAVCYGADYTRWRGTHCEVVGCENADIEACHILPRCDYGDLADGQGGTNIITLCRMHHVILSHYGNTIRYYNINLRETVRTMNEGRREYKKYEKQR